MRRQLSWLLLTGIGLGLLLLVIRHEPGTIGTLSTDEFASLIYKIVLLLFVGSSLVVVFRQQFSKAIEAALFWGVLTVLIVVGYTYRHDLRDVAERVLAELVPGRPASRGQSVEVARTRAGEFRIGALVNGARLPMVLDTGASSVVLSQEGAKAAGLPLEVLSYDVNVDTANGRTRAAAVTLDRVAIGEIVERSVPALIAQPGQLKSNLLGMSFLNRLQSWEVRGDKLVLRGYP